MRSILKLKKLLYIIVLLTLTLEVRGQELHFKLIDTSVNWQSAAYYKYYFDLQELDSVNHPVCFRIFTSGQIIEVYRNESDIYKGYLIQHIKQYEIKKVGKPKKEERFEHQIVYSRTPLRADIVELIINKLINSGQHEIPNCSLIPNWNKGSFHCPSIKFDIAINEQYLSNYYVCPWGQNDSLKYKQIILENYNYIEKTLNRDSHFTIFLKSLPKGKVYSDDGYGFIYVMTDKQNAIFIKNRPIRDYLSSIEDTVNQYLKSELNKQIDNMKRLSCYSEYYLTFGKNGKLKKVETAKSSKPSLRNSIILSNYFYNRRKYRNCLKEIKKLFENIDLSFLDLKYEVHRKIRFTDSGYILMGYNNF